MVSDAINAGVKHGGLNNRSEIRVLICYLLCNINEPLPLYTVNEMLHFEGIANYFEVTYAINELLENGHIKPLEDKKLQLFVPSESAKDVVEALGSSLPKSVKDKALKLTRDMITKKKIESENLFLIEKVDNGFLVTCSVLEKNQELMTVKMVVPSESFAEKVKEKFINNPTEIIRGITNLLTDANM